MPVLIDWSYAKLKKAPCHYYGTYYEKDFVIAAHNYKSHFGRLSELIKRIDVHNSTKDEHGHKHVPIDIYFTAVGIINIPTEEELIAAMEEMREKPLKSA